MNIREVTEAPAEHEGMCHDERGAIILCDTLNQLGWSVEIVLHRDTYYVVNR